MHQLLGKLNELQKQRMSEISGNLGLVFFASVLLSIFIGEKDPDPFFIMVGIFLTVASWFVSILLLKGKRKNDN